MTTPTNRDDDRAHLAAIDARHDAWRRAVALTDETQDQFVQAIVAANDDGVSYRTLGEHLGWSFGYVGQLVRAHRDQQQEDRR